MRRPEHPHHRFVGLAGETKDVVRRPPARMAVRKAGPLSPCTRSPNARSLPSGWQATTAERPETRSSARRAARLPPRGHLLRFFRWRRGPPRHRPACGRRSHRRIPVRATSSAETGARRGWRIPLRYPSGELVGPPVSRCRQRQSCDEGIDCVGRRSVWPELAEKRFLGRREGFERPSRSTVWSRPSRTTPQPCWPGSDGPARRDSDGTPADRGRRAWRRH
jgi:hypothetical protein